MYEYLNAKPVEFSSALRQWFICIAEQGPQKVLAVWSIQEGSLVLHHGKRFAFLWDGTKYAMVIPAGGKGRLRFSPTGKDSIPGYHSKWEAAKAIQVESAGLHRNPAFTGSGRRPEHTRRSRKGYNGFSGYGTDQAMARWASRGTVFSHRGQ